MKLAPSCHRCGCTERRLNQPREEAGAENYWVCKQCIARWPEIPLMTLDRLTRHIHSMRIETYMEHRSWRPEEHTIFLTREEWEELLTDRWIGRSEAVSLVNDMKVYGVNIVPVSKLPESLR